MIRKQDALSLTKLLSGLERSDKYIRFTKDGSGFGCNSRSHCSSSYVGTGFIGGEDQGYIACP
jgi:hypothetical protein